MSIILLHMNAALGKVTHVYLAKQCVTLRWNKAV